MINILIIDNNVSDLDNLNNIIYKILPDSKVYTSKKMSDGRNIALYKDPDIIIIIIDSYFIDNELYSDNIIDENYDFIKEIPLLFIGNENVDSSQKIRAIELGAKAFISRSIEESELLLILNNLSTMKEVIRSQKQEQLNLEQLVEQRTYELKQSNIEAKQALQKLKKENELRNVTEFKLQPVLKQLEFHKNNSPLAVIEYDKNEIITDWSKGAEKIFGWSKDYVIGKAITDFKLVYEEDLDDVIMIIPEMLKSSLNNKVGVNRNYCKDGSIITCEWYTSILTDDKGEIISVHSMALDITNRLEVENEKELLLSENIERIKELNCLYSITKVNKKQGVSLKTIISEIIDLIPVSWRHSDVASCKIEYNGTVFKTDNFVDTKWKLASNIIINDKVVGDISVCYLQEKPLADNGPFVKEERELLDAIAMRLGHIIDRKQAEEELQEAIEFQEQVINSAHEGIIVYGKDLSFQLWNPYMEKLTGMMSEEVIGKQSDDLFPFLKKSGIIEMVKEGLKGVKNNGIEFEFDVGNNGRKGWASEGASPLLNFKGEIIGVISTVRDITIRKEAEETLLKNEKRLVNMFESMSEGFSIQDVICDDKGNPVDLRFVEANSAFENQTGLINSETLGHTLLELFPSSEKYWIERYGKVGITGEPISFEAMFGPLNIFYHVNAFQTQDCQVGILFTDINDRKLHEIELTEAKDKAEESDRLKSAFLANMSHEIRTPMNGILGFASLLKEPDLSGEKQNKYISIIEKSGTRMLNIINDIVSISKIESGLMELDIQESNLNDQIEYIYTFFKPEMEAKGITFDFFTPLDSISAVINTDKEKLYAILTNLVKNAVKYTDNGNISMGYGIDTNRSTNDEGDVVEESKIEVYVKDTGIGIPKERHEAIFERFIQADISDKMAKQGAGLGLSISKAYVEMMGGKLWVESDIDAQTNENLGSTFYFTLPFKQKKILNVYPEDFVFNINKIPNNSLKILIVEDDESSEMLLRIAIEDIASQIISVDSGYKAVREIHDNPDIDVILMDIQLPGINGYQATQQIRDFNKDVIIIAQTAYALSGDKEKAIAAGCNEYIPKPINPNLLNAKIIRCINAKNM